MSLFEFEDCTTAEVHSLRHNRCPDCGNYGFHDGPRGGASQNIFCANPHCRAGFNIAPHFVMCQRIGKGPLGCYPPRVHAILPPELGRPPRPLCAFTQRVIWPRGHAWSGAVDCPECLAELRRLTEGK